MQCTFSGCEGKATFHLSWIGNRRCTTEQHLCEEHGRAAIASYGGPASEFSGTRNVVPDARQFDIGLVVISEISDQQVVYLHELDGSRLVPIKIGLFEAMSLDRRLKGDQYPRPLTHDAIPAAIWLLGGEVRDVVVNRLENQIYYAYARIRHQGDLLLLDLRPSDAFVLAVLCDCTIFVANRVLDQIDQHGSIK